MKGAFIKNKLLLSIVLIMAGLFFLLHNISVYGATYEYDSLGRVTRVIYEDGDSVTYSYDGNGNMTETVSTAQGELSSEEPEGKGQATGERIGDGQTDTRQTIEEQLNESLSMEKRTGENDGSSLEENEEWFSDADEKVSSQANETEGMQNGNYLPVVGAISAALMVAVGVFAVVLYCKRRAERGDKSEKHTEEI